MSMSLGHNYHSSYSEQRKEIDLAGEAILKIAKETNNIAIVGFLNEVLDKLSREESYLAILGLFKRGKSTLINALLKQAIIPTGVVPVTSVITRISFGNDIEVKVSFGDGSQKKVLVEQLCDYVTEAGNPNNIKNVIVADVFVPAPILKDGLILIDTPGVGSTYIGGTKVTFQFLDRVDFAVFVLAVDPPMGQQELELLSSLACKSNKILFVLNKIDYVDSVAVDESVKYCQKVINEHLGSTNESPLLIYPISAKLALEGRLHNSAEQIENSGILKFETALKQSLISEKENLMIRSAWKKIEKSAQDLKTYLMVELNSLTLPLNNLVYLIKEFERYLEVVEQKKREVFYVLDGRIKEIIALLDEDLATFKKDHENALVKKVEDFAQARLKSEKTSSRVVANEVDDYLKKSLIDVYSEFITQEELEVESRFQDLVTDVNEKINVLIGDVKRKAAQLFGFEAQSILFSVSLDFETRFYYQLDPIFTTRITFSSDEIATLLPKSLFKGIIEKKLDERTRAELDKNGGRIRYEYFISRLNQAVLKLKRDINQALQSSTETVKNAVQEAERLRTMNETGVFTSVKQLNKLLGELQSVEVKTIRK